MCVRALSSSRVRPRFRCFEQRTDAPEQIGVGAEHRLQMWLRQCAKIVEHHQRDLSPVSTCARSVTYSRKKRLMRAPTVASCAAVATMASITSIERRKQAVARSSFLRVVGHAVGDQTDARGNAGQCCPFTPSSLNRLAAAPRIASRFSLKAGCLRRAGGRRGHGGKSQDGASPRRRSFGQKALCRCCVAIAARWSAGASGQIMQMSLTPHIGGKIRLESRTQDSRPNRRRWIH